MLGLEVVNIFRFGKQFRKVYQKHSEHLSVSDFLGYGFVIFLSHLQVSVQPQLLNNDRWLTILVFISC